MEYRYSWSGFRKTFQTLVFAYYWKKYQDSGVALEMVSKRMKHSSKGITAKHYIENVDSIQANQYLHLLPFEITNRIPRQENLFELFV